MADTVSSDEDSILDYKPYSKRNDWKDVTPVSSEESVNVVKINYTPQFRDCFSYFRAILRRNELSDRAFNLTLDAAHLNPANYTVWQFRRTLIQHLNKDLKDELLLIRQFIREHPKNYQVWHHCQMVVQWLNDASDEKNFTAQMFKEDAKNYHAWQYRQWFVREFNLWDGELEYTADLIGEDCRNNSAWNHRYFVLSNTTEFEDSVLKKEIEFTLEVIRRTPHNESPWNFLKGLLLQSKLSSFPEILAYCESLYAENCRSPFLLSFLIDALSDEAAEKRDIPRAIELCDMLANDYDIIRASYWQYRRLQLTGDTPPSEQTGAACSSTQAAASAGDCKDQISASA